MSTSSSDQPNSLDQSQKAGYGDEIDLISYIQVLLKRKVFILLTTLCFAIVGFIYVWLNKTYEAHTLVLLSLKVEQKKATVDLEQGTPGMELFIPSLSANSYQILATTGDLSRSLYDSVKVAQSDTTKALPPYRMEAELIGQPGNVPTQLMTLRVISPNPDMPAVVANTWARLFVERNRGLSSGVARSYHEWVNRQYDIAEENLTKTERDLQRLDAQYNNLHVLQNEISIKNIELDAALKSFQYLEVSLDSKKREQRYWAGLLNTLEMDGEWIGFLTADQLRVAARDGSRPSSMRQNLIGLMQELRQLEQDSTQTFQKHEEMRQEFAAYSNNQHLVFNRDKQINLVRNQVEHLTQVLDGYHVELPDLQSKIKSVGIELAAYKQNIEKEKAVLTLGKAITDDALWNQSVSNGRVSEETQKNLARYHLKTEEINPVYQKLVLQEVELRVRKELYQQRIDFLENEIPVLQSELIELQDMLDNLEVTERELENNLADREFLLSKQIHIEVSQLVNKLHRRRLSYEDYRAFYFSYKQQEEALGREIQRIQSDIAFQRGRFVSWRDDIEALAAKTDSLQIARNQLDRNLVIYKETFLRFSKLLEAARIALEQAAGDLQVISWASGAGVRSNTKYIVLFGFAGVMIAVFLVFAFEFIEKAQKRLKETN